TELVATGLLDLSTLIDRMSCAPARSMGLEERIGSLAEGRWADVTLIDPRAEWTVDPDAFLSLSRNTPFRGRRLRCRAVRTLVGGVTVWQG
ncbi:MAG TPA: amidohydrolase family protein, partial [Longimicrobium sp.]